MGHRRANKPNKALEEWGREIVREDIREAFNKMPRKFPEPDDEQIAADRRERETWPVNDYVLGAALMLIGAVVLIAIALATGLVKP